MASSDIDSSAKRLIELTDMAERLDGGPRMRGEPPGGWYARAMAETIERRMEADRAAHRTVAESIAALMTNGLVAFELLGELHRWFPAASRADAYRGAATAITDLEARLRVAQMGEAIALAELEAARQEIAALRAPVAA